MKRLFVVAAASAMVSSPAFAANTASDSFVINASIPDTCTMQNVNDVNLGTLNISTTAGNGALLLSSDSSANTNQFWVSCNKQNTMTLTGPAQLQGSRAFVAGVDDASFTDKLNYRVAAVNYLTSGTQPELRSVGGTTPSAQRGPVHRQVRMNAAVVAGDNTLRPLAGNYTGTVTVTVTAN
jgi:hypothetical protein